MRWHGILMAAALSLGLGGVTPTANAQKEDKPKDMVLMYPRNQSFLGVAVAEVNAERAKSLKLREEHGVEITRVEEESPAAKAGLQPQDVVLEYQGQRVEGIDQFIRLVRETPAGRQVKMLVARAGQTMNLGATIEAKKMRTLGVGDMQIAIPQIPELRMNEMPRPMLSWRGGLLGVEAEELNPQLAEFFGVKDGVLVRSVSKGSAAEQAGIRAGDVIVKVDGKPVSSPSEVTRALRAAEKKPVGVAVVRDKKEMAVSVTVSSASEDTRPRGRTVRNQEFQF
ncbi:MAG: PDZ domain-containing protein [Acidobacteria bacterium]|nr:PDZ domain-containing protein [Acidobacteriota bacterium]